MLVVASAVVTTGCGRSRGEPTASPSVPPPAETPEASASAPAESTAPAHTTVSPAPTATVEPSAGAPAPGVYEGKLTSGGRERTYRLYVPRSLSPGQDVPLVVALHGGLGSGKQMANATGFDEEAEKGVFLVVYPDGTGIGQSDLARTWNGGRAAGRR